MEASKVDDLQAKYAAQSNLESCRAGDCRACIDFCKGYALRVDFFTGPGTEVGEALWTASSLNCVDRGLEADLDDIGGVVSAIYHAKFGP